MRYKRLLLACQCGTRPTRFQEIGFTADHQLLVYWRCSHCKKHVYLLKPLTECWAECPSQEDGEVPEVENRRPSLALYDERFLKSVGVRFPSEDEETVEDSQS